MLFSGCSFTASFFSCDIRLHLTYMPVSYSVAPLSLMMFSSSESDVRYTRLLDLAIVAAMSFAVYASQPAAARTLMRRSSMKPGLFSMASPIRRAEVASPSALDDRRLLVLLRLLHHVLRALCLLLRCDSPALRIAYPPASPRRRW